MRDDLPITSVYFWALPELMKKRAKTFKQVLEHKKMRKLSILYEKMWGERYLVDLWTYCFERGYAPIAGLSAGEGKVKLTQTW